MSQTLEQLSEILSGYIHDVETQIADLTIERDKLIAARDQLITEKKESKKTKPKAKSKPKSRKTKPKAKSKDPLAASVEAKKPLSMIEKILQVVAQDPHKKWCGPVVDEVLGNEKPKSGSGTVMRIESEKENGRLTYVGHDDTYPQPRKFYMLTEHAPDTTPPPVVRDGKTRIHIGDTGGPRPQDDRTRDRSEIVHTTSQGMESGIGMPVTEHDD